MRQKALLLPIELKNNQTAQQPETGSCPYVNSRTDVTSESM